MHGNVFGITANSLMGTMPFYTLLSIASCLLLILAIRFWVNALSDSKTKAEPMQLHVVPIARADERYNTQNTCYLGRSQGAENGKKRPLPANLLSEDAKLMFEQDPARVAERRHEQNHRLEFEAIETPEIEPCGGVDVAFERYCATTGRRKNAPGDQMLLQ